MQILTPAGEFDIFKMTVFPDSTVFFSGLRMADGIKVIGEIDASGNVEIIDESTNSSVSVLKRVK